MRTFHRVQYFIKRKGNQKCFVCNKNEITKKSLETKAKLIFVKDVREHDLQHVKDVLSTDFYFYISFPTTAIPILAMPYPQALRKKNRKRYKNSRKTLTTTSIGQR